jgi:DNA-directed RNA polymerase subunit beta'
MFKGTFGQAIFQSTMPEGFRPSGNFGVGEIKSNLINLARKDPDKFAIVAPQIKKLGDEFSTYEGLSVGLDDIEPEYKKRDPILRAARSALKKTNDPDQIGKILHSAQQKMLAVTQTHKGDMGLMARSGAKGNMTQLMKAVASPVVVGDPSGRPVPFLFERGYGEGLSPAEAWIGAVEARHQGNEANTAVSAPGEMSKIMNQNMNRLVVSQADCGTSNGIMMESKDPSIIGRYLASSNSLVDSMKRRSLSKKGGKIKVRSSLTCELDEGICQKCSGRDAYDKDPEIGMNIGARSAQALTEPLSQMALSSRHGVSLVKGDADKPTGLKAFRQTVEMPESFHMRAPVAELSGKVEAINKAPQGGYDLRIGGSQHYVPPNRRLKVKPGQIVESGDVLSSGIPSPSDIIKHKGIGAGRQHMVKALKEVYDDSGIKVDQKHLEMAARSQINYVKALDRVGDVLPGEIIPYQAARKAFIDSGTKYSVSKSLGKVLTKPTLHHLPGTKVNKGMVKDFKDAGIGSIEVSNTSPKFEPVAMSASRTPLLNPNWMQRLGWRYQKQTLINAATSGETADLSGMNPISALVSGTLGRKEKGRY